MGLFAQGRTKDQIQETLQLSDDDTKEVMEALEFKLAVEQGHVPFEAYASEVGLVAGGKEGLVMAKLGPAKVLIAKPDDQFVTLPELMLEEMRKLTTIGEVAIWKTDTADENYVRTNLRDGMTIGIPSCDGVKVFSAKLTKNTAYFQKKGRCQETHERCDWIFQLIHIRGE